MRIQLLSDLHLEFSDYHPSPPDSDVVVLAGDIANGLQGIHWARERFNGSHRVYVPGNHEYYGWVLEALNRELKRAAVADRQRRVHLLLNAEVCLDGVYFIGATLWTDFSLFGAGYREADALIARTAMFDYHAISTRRACRWPRVRQLEPQDTLALHRVSLAYISDRIRAHDAAGEPCVVVTHHAPSTGSLAPRFARQRLSAAFISDLDALLTRHAGPALWLHGHTHDCFDYQVGGTRVVCNARGYPGESAHMDHAFDPERVIELDTRSGPAAVRF